MKTALVVTFAMLVGGCASTPISKAPPVRLEDGLTAATSVILKPGSIADGVANEDEWLNRHYPGFRRCHGGVTAAPSGEEEDELVHFAHHTEIVAGRVMSVLCVVLPDGTEKEFYFDITECYNTQTKTLANQSREPTATAGTPAAEQPSRQP